jgi:cholesterol oxidase
MDFDAIVIGSGFGGAVAASRMVEQDPKLRVLILERGLPYPPGSFPRTPRDMRQGFWGPTAGMFGLFDVWAFRRVGAMVASGLGGGSLIYSNVLLKKPPDSFGADGPNGWTAWPVAGDQLEDDYEAVRSVLSPVTLPESYDVPKNREFMEAARRAGLEPELAELAVTFSSNGHAAHGLPLDDENLHRRLRRTCTLKGECNLGCNQGAKNSLDYTYLSTFLEAGGTIRTCCEAVRITQTGNGYDVRYVEHAAARRTVQLRARDEGHETDLRLIDERGPDLDEEPDSWTRTASAAVVVLAAGSLGSTRLLLTSRTGLPRLSPQLGRRFSLNGDLITFARGCRDGDGESWRTIDPSTGPVITAFARPRTSPHDIWMQDAGGPEFSTWLWQGTEAPRLRSLGRTAVALTRGRRGGRAGDLIARCFGSAAASSAMLPLLTMGRDGSSGRLRLEGDGLAMDFDGKRTRAYYEEAERLARAMANHLGGTLRPRFANSRHRRVTVHPLGGCPMAENISNGVVDARGEVHNAPGLFVADGSVMPGPVGPNPSLTIAAFARRIGAAAAVQAAGGRR